MGAFAAAIPAVAGAFQSQQDNYKPKEIQGQDGQASPGGFGGGHDPSNANAAGSLLGPTFPAPSEPGSPSGGAGSQPNYFELGSIGQRLGMANQDRSFGEGLIGNGELPLGGRMLGQVYSPAGIGEIALSMLPKFLGWKMMQGAKTDQTALLDKEDKYRPGAHKIAQDDLDAQARRFQEILRAGQQQKPAGSQSPDDPTAWDSGTSGAPFE